MNEMGKGVFVEVTDEGKILIEVDGTKDFGPSSSGKSIICLLYTSPSPRDQRGSRMPSSA